jgi:hypothetical protein
MRPDLRAGIVITFIFNSGLNSSLLQVILGRSQLAVMGIVIAVVV